MKDNEAKEIVKTIESAYPYFYPNDREKAKAKLETWKRYLLKWDYEQTKKKLDEHIESSQYEPKISEVKPTDKYKPDYSWKEGLYD